MAMHQHETFNWLRNRVEQLEAALAAVRERNAEWEHAWEEMRTSILHESNGDQGLTSDQINHVLSIIDSERPDLLASPRPGGV